MSRAESAVPVNEEVAEEVEVTQDFDEIDKLAELAIGAADIKKYVFPHKDAVLLQQYAVLESDSSFCSMMLLLSKDERCRVLHGVLCPHEDEEGSVRRQGFERAKN